jgi:hypothetical protein
MICKFFSKFIILLEFKYVGAGGEVEIDELLGDLRGLILT